MCIFEQSKNVRTYAAYLNDKVLAYKAIRIDHITQKNPPGSQIYLKAPTDIKFMLLEVSTVQKQLHSVLKNRFDSDTLDNETTFSAFRYCLRDMLKLFQVMNLGVMKMLKVYFEMREDDMKRALDLYKRFVKLTDRTDEYLKISRQFEAIFGFSIPNLTHAPLSLSKALEDFLNMPEDERKSAVTQMKTTAKKPEPGVSGENAESGGSQKREQQGGSVRRGPNGKPKPDYGLRLKPELLEGGQKPEQKPDTTAAKAKETLPKTLSPKPAAASAVSSGPSKAAAEIDFIDFFSSIDDEMATTVSGAGGIPAAQPQQQMQMQMQMQPFGQMDMNTQHQQQQILLQQQQQQPQPLATADFDTMFNALSNPFAATAAINNNMNSNAYSSSMTDSTALMLDNNNSQAFNAFSGSMSSVALPSAANDSIGSQFASFSNTTQTSIGVAPNTMSNSPFQQQQGNMGFGNPSVSANNPFRQSMYPTDVGSQQLAGQMAQMSLQQQQQPPPLPATTTTMASSVSYNPFTQRQTMYLDSSSACVATPFSGNASQQTNSAGVNSASPFASNGGQQFADFSSAFGTGVAVNSQQQNATAAGAAHGLQSSMNNGNFANFDFFK
ncbi:hypothetical protein LPJ57_001599 [Coemansia sp. RSA 486]|nr:hypothetical protein LPJ57_001599 [Coemansia sp. RSA 486]